jgi:predicted RNase H-like nuclease (RuvC/YqgF family)
MSLLDKLAEPAILGPICVLVGGLASHVLGWRTKRVERAPDMQESVNAAVASAVSLYTATLTRAEAAIAQLSREVMSLKAEVSDLNEHITDLTSTLERHNIPPPARRPKNAGKLETP